MTLRLLIMEKLLSRVVILGLIEHILIYDEVQKMHLPILMIVQMKD